MIPPEVIMNAKKLVCLCGIVLLSLLLAVPVFAADPGIVYQPGEVHINPLYADILDEQDLFTDQNSNQPRRLLSPGDPEEFDTVAEAAVYLKEQMKARNTSVTIKMNGSYYPSVLNEIFNAAIEHDPSDPTGGDYLRWQYGGWSAPSFSVAQDYYTPTFNISYFTTAAQEEELTAAVDAVLDSLDLDGKTDAVKLRLIYDFIKDNITYDYANLNDNTNLIKHSAYAALINRTAVCQGYANLLYRMLLETGIDCRLIAGLGNGGDHAWNIVKLGDVYYDVDVTWDSDGGLDYNRYYLRCDANFGDHVRGAGERSDEIDYTSSEFYAAYPMSSADYGYTLEDGVLTISGDLGRVYHNFLAYRVGKESGIQSVVLEDGITKVSRMAFYECASLKDVTVKGPVTEIAEYAFTHCTALETLTIPATVTAIAEAAVNDCGALKDIYFGGTESDWSNVEVGQFNYPILNHSATIHFQDPSESIVASADLGERFTCTVNADDTVSVSGAESLSSEEQVLIAEYDGSGRFSGVHFITASKTTADLESDPARLLFFWLSSLFVPKSESVSVAVAQ